MDEAKVATMFVNTLRGNWLALPDDLAPPAAVIEDSRHWSSVLLAEAADPYRQATLLNQQFSLGLGRSPDRLITTAENGRLGARFTLYETLQDYIVIRGETGNGTGDARPADEIDRLAPLLSAAAGAVVTRHVTTPLTDTLGIAHEESAPIPLATSDVSLNALLNWDERVDLFWFDGKVYAHFFKTYPGSAAGPIRPGLDWHTQDLRVDQGIERA